MEIVTGPIALSRQEKRVVALSMEGLGDKEIAKDMGLSLGTVRTYWKRIQTKVGGQTRAEIVAIVARIGPQAELEAERTITARLQAEIEQRKVAEERFRAMCACSPLSIYMTDEYGSCIYVNAAWERLTGLPVAAGMGSGWKQAVHPEDLSILEERWQNLMAGVPQAPQEFRFLRRGRTIRVRSHVNRVVVDGRTLGYLGMIEEIGPCAEMAAEDETLLASGGR